MPGSLKISPSRASVINMGQPSSAWRARAASIRSSLDIQECDRDFLGNRRLRIARRNHDTTAPSRASSSDGVPRPKTRAGCPLVFRGRSSAEPSGGRKNSIRRRSRRYRRQAPLARSVDGAFAAGGGREGRSGIAEGTGSLGTSAAIRARCFAAGSHSISATVASGGFGFSSSPSARYDCRLSWARVQCFRSSVASCRRAPLVTKVGSHGVNQCFRRERLADRTDHVRNFGAVGLQVAAKPGDVDHWNLGRSRIGDQLAANFVARFMSGRTKSSRIRSGTSAPAHRANLPSRSGRSEYRSFVPPKSPSRS